MCESEIIVAVFPKEYMKGGEISTIIWYKSPVPILKQMYYFLDSWYLRVNPYIVLFYSQVGIRGNEIKFGFVINSIEIYSNQKFKEQ